MKKATLTRLSLAILAVIGIIATVGCKPAVDPNADVTAPTVALVAPVAAATGVALNGVVTATFSEAMDAATMIADNFSLMAGTTAIAGIVSYDEASMTVTFTPTALLPASTAFTATVAIGAADVAGNALAEAYAWSFTTGVAADVTAPTVASTVPVASATNVAINAAITATFSEPMYLPSLTSAFTLKQGTTAVAGAVTIVGNTATFDPTADLAVSTVYTGTISTVAKDLAGNALALEKTWTFTTSAAPDTTAPTVLSTAPVASATGVAINSVVTATFSEPMLLSSLASAFTLKQGATLIPSVVTSVDNTVTLDPDASLAAATEYTATITVGAKDLANNALALEKTWTFTTGGSADTTAPTVLSTVPADVAHQVAIGATINVTFSEAMLPSSIILADTFKLTGPGTTVVPGAVTNTSTTTARFTPTSNLVADTTYTATVTVAAKDAAGNAMAAEKVWQFYTGTRPNNPRAPTLGETARFVILASAAVTTTGTTTIHNGDMGLKDAARSLYAGFTPGVNPGVFDELTNGLSYAHDDTDPALIPAPYASTIAFLDQVRTDMAAADTFLGADPNPDAATQVCATELGGLTLARGVFKTAVGVTISTGDVTLDAQGDPNSRWVFVIGGTLTTGAPGGNVVLINGAQAKNVYWRTSGDTSIAGAKTFAGNVFAAPKVVVGSGALITGRLFAMTDRVTLIADTVTKPE